ncbi:hypothetical protein Ae201684P_014400 [Aphanomyces euteiches]|uniref:Uncharacterized protein n=2 Tax=Aphanomyces euteiches TaxID=100861 RepID=A0A6G0WRG2_9STRA|nr:hypothetical protein Ae201684_012443 [Aphanomyces euteiches]KAH9090604.1 hypothetical protein Ae201684P_014400 [Aphanomyces euteiches]KAH9153016.1 hypothetical protein AeRB84_004665 [Aphanomyces euteiches]
MKCFPGLGCVGTTRVRVQRARDTVGNFNWLQHSLAGSCTVAAGVAMKPYGVIEGVESTLFNNHVAHQLLAIRFLPFAQIYQQLDLDLPSEANYSSVAAYNVSKLANVMMAYGLLKRADRSKVFINSLHPGIVSSDLVKSGVKLPQLPRIIRPALEWFTGFFFRSFGYTPLKGALTHLYVASSPDIVKNEWQGQYFSPIAKLGKSSDLSRDPEQIKRLWKWTNDLIARILGKK